MDQFEKSNQNLPIFRLSYKLFRLMDHFLVKFWAKTVNIIRKLWFFDKILVKMAKSYKYHAIIGFLWVFLVNLTKIWCFFIGFQSSIHFWTSFAWNLKKKSSNFWKICNNWWFSFKNMLNFLIILLKFHGFWQNFIKKQWNSKK